VLAPQFGNDGGFVFGRVGSERATTVRIVIPDAPALTASVAEDRFFLVALPEGTMRELMRDGLFQQDRIEAMAAVALDVEGRVVGRSTRVDGLSPLGATTTTP
jgi:hypothetical protein